MVYLYDIATHFAAKSFMCVPQKMSTTQPLTSMTFPIKKGTVIVEIPFCLYRSIKWQKHWFYKYNREVICPVDTSNLNTIRTSVLLNPSHFLVTIIQMLVTILTYVYQKQLERQMSGEKKSSKQIILSLDWAIFTFLSFCLLRKCFTYQMTNIKNQTNSVHFHYLGFRKQLKYTWTFIQYCNKLKQIFVLIHYDCIAST